MFDATKIPVRLCAKCGNVVDAKNGILVCSKCFMVCGVAEAKESTPTSHDADTKYNKPITGMDGTKTTVDVYRVLSAFSIADSENAHSIKKQLNLGTRGKGGAMQDLNEAILSLQKMRTRWIQEGIK